jgi:hypothetical protein
MSWAKAICMENVITEGKCGCSFRRRQDMPGTMTGA